MQCAEAGMSSLQFGWLLRGKNILCKSHLRVLEELLSPSLKERRAGETCVCVCGRERWRLIRNEPWEGVRIQLRGRPGV